MHDMRIGFFVAVIKIDDVMRDAGKYIRPIQCATFTQQLIQVFSFASFAPEARPYVLINVAGTQYSRRRRVNRTILLLICVLVDDEATSISLLMLLSDRFAAIACNSQV